jgi:hypothetical protein
MALKAQGTSRQEVLTSTSSLPILKHKYLKNYSWVEEKSIK